MSIAIRVYLVNRTEYTIIRVDMYDIDETDSKIIKLLEEDAWQTSEVLAKQLSVSSATVRLRPFEFHGACLHVTRLFF